MPFRYSGSTASLSPYLQEWQNVIIGTNARGGTRYSPNMDVILRFDDCAAASYAQIDGWITATSTTGGSVVTATILARDSITFVAFSNVYLEWEQRPTWQTGLAVGGFAVRLKNLPASGVV